MKHHNKLNETTVNDLKNTPYDPSKDRMGQYSIYDSRKPVITLMDIHRLKLLTMKKKFDQNQQMSLIQKIYSQPTSDDSEGGF